MSVDDLAQHGIRYRLRGLPIYDGDEQTGVIDEPEWEWDALTQEQQAVIQQTAIRLQTRDVTWDFAFWFALGEYGIRCPHKWANHEPTWRECEWCRVGEPLPGRIVQVGGRTMRVTDPPPPVLLIPVMATPTAMAMGEPTAYPTNDPTIAEYRWTGTRYEKYA